MCTNADTLTNKMPELKASVDHHNPWIIAITEIIPKNYRIPVQKAELKISNNYDIFPESISSKGRGITVQVHKNLKAQEVLPKTKFEESLWCEEKLKGNDKLLIGCIYSSEGGTSEKSRSLNNLLKKITKKNTHWETLTTKTSSGTKTGAHLV